MNGEKIEALVARLRAVSETGRDPDLPHEAADAIDALVRRAEDAEQLSIARGHTIHGLQQQLSDLKVERDALAAQAERYRVLLSNIDHTQPVNARLLEIATGEISHLYAGLCPDSVTGTRSRDPECPACRAIETATLRKQGFNV